MASSESISPLFGTNWRTQSGSIFCIAWAATSRSSEGKAQRHVFLVVLAPRIVGEPGTRQGDQAGEVAVPEPPDVAVVPSLDSA